MMLPPPSSSSWSMLKQSEPLSLDPKKCYRNAVAVAAATGFEADAVLKNVIISLEQPR